MITIQREIVFDFLPLKANYIDFLFFQIAEPENYYNGLTTYFLLLHNPKLIQIKLTVQNFSFVLPVLFLFSAPARVSLPFPSQDYRISNSQALPPLE